QDRLRRSEEQRDARGDARVCGVGGLHARAPRTDHAAGTERPAAALAHVRNVAAELYALKRRAALTSRASLVTMHRGRLTRRISMARRPWLVAIALVAAGCSAAVDGWRPEQYAGHY